MSKRGLAALVAALVVIVGGGTTTVLLTQGAGSSQRVYKTPYGVSAHSPTFGLPPAGGRLTAPQGSSAGTLEMFDSVTVSTIPHGPSAVAGYLSGNWPTFGPLKTAFPHAYHVPVAIHGLPVYKSLVGRMVCLDVEPGDEWPVTSAVGAWARGEIGLGVKPCLYSALQNGMSAVKQSLAATLGFAWRSKVFLWDADWTNTAHLDAGFDATQWTSHAFGRNLDESMVTKGFLGIKPPPQLPVCYHHRITRYQCNLAKDQVAKDRRAISASNGAYDARGCPTLAARVTWFSTRLREHPKTKTASRRKALAASRRVYGHRSCGVFKQRANHYSAAESRTISAN